MHPPVLFLDIDGVLIAFPEGEPTAPQFTPQCVEALKVVIAAVPRLQIVFSTTWRLGEHVNRLHSEWLAHRLPIAITRDGTPDTREDPSVPRIHRRGREIEAWLAAHPGVSRWAVIDDDRLAIEPILSATRCVFTDPARGMDTGHAERLIAILC
ncbi:HAD domain-containing protein [Luteolibacter arcticus]|uniref:HAD domain-containing protein n=1 Tax=Luteolibacter arcticus TaxID=1581411 RepID=A0ABT3GLS5_9BACT|nr:HAD domain-containing protein [Luteolibacter arcticus]MCW1924479.1 HAD domain-containing protein [Luteolibacter arcticus]